MDILVGLNRCFESIPSVALEKDCIGGLLIEAFDDSDKVGTDIVLLHGCL